MRFSAGSSAAAWVVRASRVRVSLRMFAAFRLGKASKAFFFEKKKQKTFAPPMALPLRFIAQVLQLAERARKLVQAGSKSFLLLFLEKEGLASFL